VLVHHRIVRELKGNLNEPWKNERSGEKPGGQRIQHEIGSGRIHREPKNGLRGHSPEVREADSIESRTLRSDAGPGPDIAKSAARLDRKKKRHFDEG